jgi:transposase
MYLKCHERQKDGKLHRYWSILESYRLANGRGAKRQVLYLGEINDAQKAGWLRIIEAFESGAKTPRQVALFPCDRSAPEALPAQVQSLKLDLKGFELHRPRQWGACWLALKLWDLLELDGFFQPKLPPSRKGTQWHKILQLLVCNRFIDPASEWFVHRHWYRQTALSDLLGLEKDIVPKNALYHCHDRLLKHQKELFGHLRQRWENLFDAQTEVLLYDLTSTYFESDPPFPEGDKRQFGYSRDKRPDCVQVVIALVVTSEGFPLAYEVMAGNTQDKKTLRDFLEKIQDLHGKARRIWVMDRGIPTEEVLEEMRASDPPVHYLVGTPKGRLTQFEKRFLQEDWQSVRHGVEVKQIQESREIYVLARSARRTGKERSMRRRRLKKLWKRLHELKAMKKQTRDELLMRLGAARKEAGRAWALVEVQVPGAEEPLTPENFNFKLNTLKLRRVFRREGQYLLRAFVPQEMTPTQLWRHYIGLTEIEQSFKTLKGDLSVRPIHHQLIERIEAHVFISFLAYCLHVALRGKLKSLAGGLTPRAVLDKFASVEMLDVHFPIQGEKSRRLVMPRYTQPDKDLKLLLTRMGMVLPQQPPPRIESDQSLQM